MKKASTVFLILGVTLLVLSGLNWIGCLGNIRSIQLVNRFFESVQSPTLTIWDLPKNIHFVFISGWALVLLGWMGLQGEWTREAIGSRERSESLVGADLESRVPGVPRR